jgi:hypothetical protein
MLSFSSRRRLPQDELSCSQGLSKTSFQQKFVKLGFHFKFVVACYSISYQL